jgi:polyferredoxin
MATSVNRSLGSTLVALLAIAQGVAGILRAAQWIQIGSDLAEQGVLLLPIVGAIAVTRGVIVGAIALLFGLFAWGTLAGRGWAWGMGLAAVIANGLAVLRLLLGGAPPPRVLVWAIVPLILIVYLLSPAGRRAGSVGRER